MTLSRMLQTVDQYREGEVLRAVVGGVAEIPGETIAAPRPLTRWTPAVAAADA